MRLFLCEKPDQARELAPLLGSPRRGEGFIETAGGILTWAIGHLLTPAPPEAYNPDWKRWALDTLPMVPELWQVLPYPDKTKQVTVIKRLLSKASTVVIATDCGREGELIARELLDYAGYRGPVQRLWYSALDEASLRKALADIRPGSFSEPLYRSALARQRADWLVGMNLTRAASIVLSVPGKPISIGRVQTPTLALVVRRDLAIENFQPRDYYELIADVATAAGTFPLRYAPPASPEDRRIYDKAAAEALAATATGHQGPLRVTKERKRSAPPKLFDLSGLQKAANKRWGWTAAKTLDIAQALYEKHKATTYPRTDCVYLPNEQESDIPAILGHLADIEELADIAQLGAPVIRPAVFNTAKITEHHAIIPTRSPAPLQAMTADEKQAYLLIARHYLAALYPDYEYDQTTVELPAGEIAFRGIGRAPAVAGWKVVFGHDAEDSDSSGQTFPPLEDGQPAEIRQIEVKTRTTTPPERYTEATLLADMEAVAKYLDDPTLKARLKETSGIGTPATRANIIETIKKRDYVATQGKYIVSTPAGRTKIAKIPAVLADPGQTALWEDRFADIEQGALSVEEFLAEITEQVRQHTAAITALQGSDRIHDAQQYPCPSCQKPLRRRKGTNGIFWGCSGYPDCKTTLPDVRGKPGTPRPPAQLREDVPCPQCGGPTRYLKGRSKVTRKPYEFFGCADRACKGTVAAKRGRPLLPAGN